MTIDHFYATIGAVPAPRFAGKAGLMHSVKERLGEELHGAAGGERSEYHFPQ